jgi:hypothetical protein
MDDFTKLGIAGIAVLAVAITKGVMHITADWFDKERFAPLVSLLSGVAASLLWEVLMPDTGYINASVRGVIIGLVGSGGFDHLKAIAAIKKNGK